MAKRIDFFYIVGILYLRFPKIHVFHSMMHVADDWGKFQVFENEPSRSWPSITKATVIRSRYVTLTCRTAMVLVTPGTIQMGFQKIPHIPILRLPFQKQRVTTL